MAPRTRSSHNTSRNTSRRPSSSLEASEPAPSSSAPEVPRPRKQRKTIHDASVPTDQSQEPLLSQASNSSASQQDQQPTDPEYTEQDTPARVLRWNEPWAEPPLAPPLPSYKTDSKKKTRAFALTPNTPLGVYPSTSLKRKLGLLPTANATPVPAKKTGSKSVKSTSAATTSAEEAGPSESPFGDLFELSNNKSQIIHPLISTMETTNTNAEAAPVSGQSRPSLLVNTPLSLKHKPEQIFRVVDAVIARAQALNDTKVVAAMRHIKELTGTEKYVFGILDAVMSEPEGPEERSLYQSLVRESAKQEEHKKVQAYEAQGVTAMTRTQSSISTSSLSSAKSLDAETFAPAMTTGRAADPAKGRGGRGVKGKRQQVIRSSRSIFPSLEDAATRKRNRLVDPEYSDEALAAKRAALSRPFTDISVPESNIRDSDTPVAHEPAFLIPSIATSTGSKRSIEALESGGEDDGVPLTTELVPKRARKSVALADEMDNIDFCHACGGSGQLLCCDGCVSSYHFSCLDPPEDPESPPEGQWFCPACDAKGLWGAALEDLEGIPSRNYELPAGIRSYFEGADTGEDGTYKHVPALPKGSSRSRVNRTGRLEDGNAYLRLTDAKGKLITCTKCGHTSGGRRMIIQCDYCPCSWHLDCLDPPLPNPPPQVPGSDNPALYWKCPNHIDHDLDLMDGLEGGRLAQLRRPRNFRFVDVEVLPTDNEAQNLNEEELSGTVYRVPERGLILDFVCRVKRDRAETQALAVVATQTARVIASSVAPGSDLTAQVPEGNVSSSRYVSEAVMVSDPEVLGDADAAAKAAWSLLAPAEHLAVMALQAIAAGPPSSGALAYPERAAQLVTQLVANAPESIRNETSLSETDILRSIQDLVGRRLNALTSDATLQ
ncbi:hypothetical protein ACO22_06697 [Paracoccidioides brasiliensis]|uniref:PHD-type domain-containing protein n=1 Tax=Paracoccidioides brasiliensis TaxID=121759 RepID=A0A1D2J731_PARBR|nr:hypothetical protein ACO22_06697 [Paracoccidioides brasiliensis]